MSENTAMNFNDSPEELAYREHVCQWLQENTDEYRDIDFQSMTEHEELPYSRRWQAAKAAAGFAAIPLASELGGGGGTAMQSIIFSQEEAKYNLPFYGYFSIGLGMAMPTMATFANETFKKQLLPKLLSGEHIWCQLFSEPSAGSDLGNVRTRAIKDSDDWVVNGQKVWTTQGHLSDYGIIVTRSDPSVPKHKGLTFFFLDMKSAGVDVRPIKQINGESEFNEVYLTDVRIPDSQRLGNEGDGWKVALTTLMFERQAGSEHSLGLLEEGDVMDFLSSITIDGKPALEDSYVRGKLADWYVNMQGLRYILYRRLTAHSSGSVPGAEAAMGKLVEAQATLDMTRFCMDLLDLNGIAITGSAFKALPKQVKTYLKSPGIRIAGGTDEILRNTIAERVLGLPQETRADKHVPFSDVKG